MTIYQDAKVHEKIIREGTVLAIDPSSGSKRSLPGFAIFKGEELVESGTIPLEVDQPIDVRLRQLKFILEDEFGEMDVLVVEKIRGRSHTYLRWACGVTIACCDAPLVFEMPTITWKKFVDRDTYEKSDEQDAIKIGEALIKLAGGLEDE